MKKNNDSYISARLFAGALIIIAVIMLACYIAALCLPCDGIELWRWLLSPVLVLTVQGNATIIGVIIFLLIIGGIFNSLEKSGIMLYMLSRITDKYGERKYGFMAAIMFFFMAMGSLIGSFEECVPMVPIVVALALKLGWDRLTGVAMSLLAVGCGFAAGVFNPFTIGIAQEIAGLPIFSGAWFRGLCFVCIYILLFFFTRSYAKKIDKGIVDSKDVAFEFDSGKELGVKLFVGIVLLGIVIVLSSAFLTFLRDYTFIIVGVMFLIAGISACLAAGLKGRELMKSFAKGFVSMLPAVLMILMASSIKYTLEYAGILNIIVDAAVKLASTLPDWMVIVFIYLFVLVMNFFIASGSAKAIMLMPLLLPLAERFGISSQLVIVAFAFGDGFSNVFYPTNPALLISLGVAETNYVDWFKWSGKFQVLNLLLTSALLLIGQAIGI